jgi:GT2 family glycosyltransferase
MSQPADLGDSLLPDGPEYSLKTVLSGTVFVILTWNQREETRRCLASLEAAGYDLGRVVLWDNGSADGTGELVQSEFPGVVYHHSAANLGVASGRNAAATLAIRAMSPTHLMFLDNDMVVTPGFLEALCEPFAGDPNLAQSLAKIRYLKEPDRLQSAGGQIVNFALGTKRSIGSGDIDIGQYDVCGPCLPCGGATLVATSVFVELDGFDPVFDPYGTEDFDFSYRVRKAGYSALYVPEAVLYHDYRSKLDGDYLGVAGFATMTERWMILLERHATPAQKFVFWTFSAPAKLVRSSLREAMRGNLAALGGIPKGMAAYVKLLLRRTKVRQGVADVGIESD